MNKASLRVFLLWLLLMLAGVGVVWNSHFTTDMSFFLPSRPSAEQQVLVDQLKDGSVSRLLMLAIEGGDAAQRASVSRGLRQRLVEQPDLVSVQNGQADALDGERNFFLRHRYPLSPALDAQRFTEAGLAEAVANTIDNLSSPVGLMLKPFLARDPTGELLALLDSLNPGAQPETRAGVWASRDGERALLLVQTRALGSDTDAQERTIAGVRSAFDQAVQASGHSQMKLNLSGPGQFAVSARDTIKEEVSRLFLISTAGIVLVLLWVFRSPRLLARSEERRGG